MEIYSNCYFIAIFAEFDARLPDNVIQNQSAW
jgi:hypothetical protein